jgi:hypothetical protein
MRRSYPYLKSEVQMELTQTENTKQMTLIWTLIQLQRARSPPQHETIELGVLLPTATSAFHTSLYMLTMMVKRMAASGLQLQHQCYLIQKFELPTRQKIITDYADLAPTRHKNSILQGTDRATHKALNYHWLPKMKARMIELEINWNQRTPM